MILRLDSKVYGLSEIPDQLRWGMTAFVDIEAEAEGEWSNIDEHIL
jgi:hypothetical protein